MGTTPVARCPPIIIRSCARRIKTNTFFFTKRGSLASANASANWTFYRSNFSPLKNEIKMKRRRLLGTASFVLRTFEREEIG